jgi:tetratricopeptide (TPR) repeat protein
LAEQKRAKSWVPVVALLAVGLALVGGKLRQWYDTRGVVSVVVLPFDGASELRLTLAQVEGVRIMGDSTSQRFPLDAAAQPQRAAELALDYIVRHDNGGLALARAAGGAVVWRGALDANALLAALGKTVHVKPYRISPPAERARQALRRLDRLEGDTVAVLAELRAAAAEALAANEAQPEAHTARAVVLMLDSHNWAEAEKHLRRALELRPADAMAARWYAHHLEANGRADDALEAMLRALSVEPLAPEVAIPLALTYIHDQQWQLAAAHLAQCEKVFPAHPALPLVRAFWHRAQADWAGTLAALDNTALAHLALPLRAEALARLGRKEEAARLVGELPASAPADLTALALLALGRTADAYAAFERAVEQRSPTLFILQASPVMENMQKNPSYRAILARLNLKR